MAAFRGGEVPAVAPAEALGLGRSGCYELYADSRRAVAPHHQDAWSPGTAGNDHAPHWPADVEPLRRKLLSAQPPAPYRFAASEIHRRLGFTIDPAPRAPLGHRTSLDPSFARTTPARFAAPWAVPQDRRALAA
ncbi:MAG TPA: hypothetical protein VKA67_08490 [Verrucomicrobiae bacterium]|nr:hypothetical protein [Verrucomicrobiae bacterium]